jgi:hypothetical protein
MAKVQTRRTISFNRNLYEVIKEHSAKDGVSTASWVAKLIRKELARRGVEMPSQWFVFQSGRLELIKSRTRASSRSARS